MRAQEIDNHITHEAKLTIGIPFELHRIIKAHATLSNSSIKNYVLDALRDKLQHEEKLTKKISMAPIKKPQAEQKTVNKKVAHLLANANKVGKKTFKDVDSTMKYLLS